MIKYSLVCEDGHGFESWFQSGDAFDTQAKRGFVACPVCNSSRVVKAIMAPAVATRRRAEPSPGGAVEAVAQPTPQSASPVALLDPRHAELREMIRAFRGRVLAEADDVGERFPEVARQIHDGGVPERAIHGQATPDEARALLEEGIAILPLPRLPDDFN